MNHSDMILRPRDASRGGTSLLFRMLCWATRNQQRVSGRDRTTDTGARDHIHDFRIAEGLEAV